MAPAKPTGNDNHYLYGPVPSRRLGFSLGVDILPFKTCSMNCVYCQLGSQPKTTVRKREFFPANDILTQIRAALKGPQRIDAVTFSGSGEPTLHSGIRKIIRGIKRTTDIPVVILTNSSCLINKKGREALLEADIVVPSLDALTRPVFEKINRPHPSLSVEKIIAGLVRFRREYKGRIWLEIMLVRGINDRPSHLKKMKEAVARIHPDKVQLNTVVRPPAETSARPLSRPELERIKAYFGESAEIIADFKAKDQSAAAGDISEAILSTAGRRPATAREISVSLGKPVGMISKHLLRLLREGKVRSVLHKGSTYYEKNGR
jgi:wyosine [tRNA(Phe)-imidazoG37] synthetase (radical SAM superfamily)